MSFFKKHADTIANVIIIAGITLGSTVATASVIFLSF